MLVRVAEGVGERVQGVSRWILALFLLAPGSAPTTEGRGPVSFIVNETFLTLRIPANVLFTASSALKLLLGTSELPTLSPFRFLLSPLGILVIPNVTFAVLTHFKVVGKVSLLKCKPNRVITVPECH